MLQDHLPPSGDEEDLILICGPDPMIKMVKEELTELGWDVPNQLIVF
jgi:NAD(P)H-flavin reductase